jgi:hypothetical protein
MDVECGQEGVKIVGHALIFGTLRPHLQHQHTRRSIRTHSSNEAPPRTAELRGGHSSGERGRIASTRPARDCLERTVPTVRPVRGDCGSNGVSGPTRRVNRRGRCRDDRDTERHDREDEARALG